MRELAQESTQALAFVSSGPRGWPPANRLIQPISVVAVFLALLALAACAGVEDRRDSAQQLARRAGLSAQILQGGAFELQTFHRLGPSPGEASSTPLRVYIEGDGFAWINRYRISPDPTPRNPQALKLAASDGASEEIYVARPSQFVGVGSKPK